MPFTYPVGSVDFWVEVVGQDGYTVLGDFDLDNGSVIQLSGGGTFYLTDLLKQWCRRLVLQLAITTTQRRYHEKAIYRYYACAVVFALILPGCGNKEPEVPVGPRTRPGYPPTGPVAPGSHYEGGYLAGPGASYTFTVNAGSVTYLEVPFTYPRWIGGLLGQGGGPGRLHRARRF